MNLSDPEQKNRLFWVLQAAGWSGWALSFYLGASVWGDAPSNYEFYVPIIALIGMLITLGLRWLFAFTWEMRFIARLLPFLMGSYFAGVLWMILRSIVFFTLFPEQKAAFGIESSAEFYAYLEGAISAAWVMFGWSALYFGIKYYILLQDAKERALKAASIANEAQLKMLRYQLNPHFLFNTLNAISTLVLDKDTTLASDMINKLSRFLRHSLESDPMLQVTVEDEVAALKLYLDIEQVRFGSRLEVLFSIDPAVKKALVPSLILQPLVENAIKYGISQSVNGGAIGVSAHKDDNQLQLIISDNGPGIDMNQGAKPQGSGVGLENCRERLRALYGNKSSIMLTKTLPHGLTVTINLPFSEESNA
jgi:two-component system LytT family sensor kinase